MVKTASLGCPLIPFMCAVASSGHTYTCTHIYTKREKERERNTDTDKEAEIQGQRQSWVRFQGCIATQVPVNISLKASFTVLSGTHCSQTGSEIFGL